MTRPDPTPHLSAVAQALRGANQPHDTFAALDKAVAAAIGHKLFTIMIHHPALGESERFYTNMPDVYPTGGRKTSSAAANMRKILDHGIPHIGYTREDIIAGYADHETILALGCESIVNTPLFFNGQGIGSMNILHQANWYSEADFPTLALFAALALPAALQIATVK